MSHSGGRQDKDLKVAARLISLALELLDDKQLEPWILDELQSALQAIEEANR